MKLIMFSKMFADRDAAALVELAADLGLDGYDLAVRPGHPVNPDNVSTELPRLVKTLRDAGYDIPMISRETDLLMPDHPTAEPTIAAMAEAGVPLLKLGYFRYNPAEDDYLARVAEVRKAFEGWQALAMKYKVKVCYHTHSGNCMGANGAAMAHLLEGFDPRHVGAYLDPGHLQRVGESFPMAVGMVRPYLSVIGLKDTLVVRAEQEDHGVAKWSWEPAGQGLVDWTGVFATLKEAAFDGPLTVHCEFRVPEDEFMSTVKTEIAFFRRYVNRQNHVKGQSDAQLPDRADERA